MSKSAVMRWTGFHRTWRTCAGLLLLLFCGAAAGQKPPAGANKERGVRVVLHNGYPELHADGKPFFIHAAAFFYYRIPADQWDASLERYRELGINTIDLRIPWNWHQAGAPSAAPKEGEEFDFTGRTHPRRDLRSLLQMIAEKGFKLIARPGPAADQDWRNGGYPEWILEQPASPDANQHEEYTRRWLAAVARELAPYAANRTMNARHRNQRGDWSTQTISGPVILVQLGDVGEAAQAAGGADSRPDLEALRRALNEGGLEGPFFVDGGQTGALTGSFPAAGDWFLRPGPRSAGGLPLERRLEAEDEGELTFSVERLKSQAGLPPLLIGFRTSWPTEADETRPPESHPANTLLASRLAIAHGAQGLSYFPLQDSLTPLGYEGARLNRHYRWDAALDVAGRERPRARAVTRNSLVLRKWGEVLATSHPRADFALALPLRTARGEQYEKLAKTAQRILRVADLAGLSVEILDPEAAPLERLLLSATVLRTGAALSPEAERALAEYEKRGGKLLPCPEEIYAWVDPGEDLTQTRMHGEAVDAVKQLEELLRQAGARPVVRRATNGAFQDDLRVGQLVSNAGTDALGKRSSGQGLLVVANLNYDEAVEETLETLSPRADTRFSGGSPQEKSGGDDYISLPLQVPPREALILPLHHSLCSEAPRDDKCRDEVIAAGAELLNVERAGKTLLLTFYTPARATILLRLERAPRRVVLEEFRPEADWIPEKKLLRISLPRGAWPTFERKVQVHLPYTPFVPERPKEQNRGRRDFDYSVADAVRLPLGDDAGLPTFPPLVVIPQDEEGRMLVEGTNYDELGRDLDVKVEGPVRGSGGVGLNGGETRQTVISLRATAGASPGPSSTHGGLGASGRSPEKQAGGTARQGSSEQEGEGAPPGMVESEMEVRSGRDRRQEKIYFVLLPKEGTATYEYDFDRDGSREWVLENGQLRVIVSPDAAGRALAILDKTTQTNLVSSVGALWDTMISPTEGMAQKYSAQWVTANNDRALRLTLAAAGGPGAGIEKTYRLAGENQVEVEYAVSPAASALLVRNSLPAVAGEQGTQFCWKETAEDSEAHCEPFAAGGRLEVPAGVRRLEVRAPNRNGTAVEWDAGTMSIEMKLFSALLDWKVPAAESSETVRRHITFKALKE